MAYPLAETPYKPNFVMGDGIAAPGEGPRVRTSLRDAAGGLWDRFKSAVASNSNVTDVPGATARGLRAVGKAVAPVGAFGTFDVVDGLREGDTSRAALGAADTAAAFGAATGVGTVPALAYGAGRLAYAAGDMIPDKGKDVIGRAVNTGLRITGLGGVDDTAYQNELSAQRMGLPSPAVGTVAPRAAAAPGPVVPNPTDNRLETGTQATPQNPRPPGVSAEPPSTDPYFYKKMGVSVLEGGRERMAQDLRMANDLRMEREREEGEVAATNAAHLALARQQEARIAGERGLREARMAFDQATQGMSPAQRAQYDVGLRNNAAQLEATRMNNETSRANTQDNNRVSLRGQDLNYGATTRGQDITARGQELTYGAATRGQDMQATTARTRAIQDQQNSDRQYELEVNKFGVDVAEKNRAARSTSAEAVRKDLETRFRTVDEKGNNVADNDKVAAFSTAMSATLPRMIEALEATGKPEAIAKAKAMRTRGAAALEPGDMDSLQQLFDRRERMRQSKGMLPGQGSFQESENLLDYRQTSTKETTFGGNRVVTPAGEVSVNDLRYTEGPANRFLPDWFKTESRDMTRGVRF